MNYRNKIVVTLFIVGVLFQLQATAQQQMENSMSQYYQSRMLWNPGFTGADGNKIYVLQNRSWVGFDGAPVMTALSGEVLFGANSAAGMHVISDVTGILYRTFGIFNYAYRLKLKKDAQLRIGISFVLTSDRLSNNYIAQTNAASDPLLANNINSAVQFDGNLGLVYTDKKFAIGASFFRLRDNLSVKSDGAADLAFLQMGGTYAIDLSDKMQLKPLAMLRVYRITESVADLGMQLESHKLLHAMLLYQTTGNIRAGAGLWLNKSIIANFFYNTNTKEASSSSQQYELGIGFHLKGKKQE